VTISAVEHERIWLCLYLVRPKWLKFRDTSEVLARALKICLQRPVNRITAARKNGSVFNLWAERARLLNLKAEFSMF
jgi:hypothetical protein